MMKKQIFFAMVLMGFVANTILCMENDEVFQRTGEQIYAKQKRQPRIIRGVKIDGNGLFDWIHLDGYQSNPSAEFEKTTVVKLKKNGRYDTRFRLRDIRKAYDKGPNGRSNQDNKKLQHLDEFGYYAKAHNAIECPDLIQLPNRDGEMKPVTVVIYPTQNIGNCELYKAFLEQQEHEKMIQSIVNLD